MKRRKTFLYKGLLHGIGTCLRHESDRTSSLLKSLNNIENRCHITEISPVSEDGLSCRLMRMVITNVLLAVFAGGLPQ